MADDPHSLKQTLARRDAAAGLFILVIGVAIAIAALRLRIGTPARMGPGFLPLALGLLLAGAGIGIVVSSARDGEALPAVVTPWPLLILTLAFVAFALLIEPMGLLPAGFAAVLIAGAASGGRRWWEGPLYAALLAGFAALLFVELLGMPLKVWP